MDLYAPNHELEVQKTPAKFSILAHTQVLHHYINILIIILYISITY